MPNWCEGVLKVRGKKKNLINFLKNGIERLALEIENHEVIEIPLDLKFDKDFDEYRLEGGKGTLHIKDTRRCFLDSLEWYLSEEDDDVMIQCIDIRQAWCLEVKQFVAISKKYHVDFKIKGYECGGQFSQEFEILDGFLNKYEEKTYKDWYWDVDDPRLGG